VDASLICFVGFFVAILIGAGLGYGAAAMIRRGK
jgi:hypothetical protein